MKGFNAGAALISLFLGFVAVTPGHTDQYYVYETPNGALVISNKEPPPGNKIIEQFGWSDATDNEIPQSQPPTNPRPNGKQNGSPKPSKNK